MGNWSEQQEVRKEVKEKDKVRREKLASLFFDLCKVTYTVLVVGLPVTLFQNELYTNYLMIALVVSTQFRASPFERALFSALNRVLLIN